MKEDIRLSTSREDAREKIQKQIEEGEHFMLQPIPDERMLKLMKEAEASWYDYTRDLLLKLFTTDRIKQEFVGVSSWGLRLNFQEKVQEFFRHLDSRLNTLRSILRRLELFEENTGTESAPEVKGIKVEKHSISESKTVWKDIEKEFGITKNSFGRKINFVSGSFKREIIFRDVEYAFVLASLSFSKPAVILAGGVIEELLRLYLKHKNITPIKNDFDGYIQTCEKEGLLKAGINRLSDSVRHFRNLVHLSKEQTSRHTISKATAKGAVASIFTIANDF